MNYFYILMFLSLWTIGCMFLIYSVRSNFWLGVTLLTGGTASFAFSIHLTIIPLVLPLGWLSPGASELLFQISVVAMSIYFYVFPYSACMGGLWFSGLMSFGKRTVLSIILAIHPTALLLQQMLGDNWASFTVSEFRWWSGLCFLLGAVFLLLGFIVEKESMARRSKKRAAIIFTIGTLWAFNSDFVGFQTLKFGEWSFDLQSNGTWHLNVVVILGLIGIIIFYTIKHGFLGIKLRIEREKLDSSMRALTMGVSILNHSIKNEIQKINYLTEKTQGYIHDGQADKSLQTIEQVHSVTAHLLEMVGRIKDKADDIVMNEGSIGVSELVRSVILPMQPLLEQKSVEVSMQIDEEGELVCDLSHVKETLSNLVHNGIDAMGESGGVLTLRTKRLKRMFVIEVKDEGCGIPKEQLVKIFEPFYTTKKNTYNHGLGLSYCMTVMRKHGGNLKIAESEPEKGTTFWLEFPIKRYVQPVSFSKPRATELVEQHT